MKTKDPLTAKEREAIEAFKRLAATWPTSLTLYVSSNAMALNIIRTPVEGEDAWDDLGSAETIERIQIPVASSS